MKYALVLLCLVFMSCQSDNYKRAVIDTRNKRAFSLVESLIYVKDTKTSLCFAVWGLDTTVYSLTTVPCVSVENLLVK